MKTVRVGSELTVVPSVSVYALPLVVVLFNSGYLTLIVSPDRAGLTAVGIEPATFGLLVHRLTN